MCASLFDLVTPGARQQIATAHPPATSSIVDEGTLGSACSICSSPSTADAIRKKRVRRRFCLPHRRVAMNKSRHVTRQGPLRVSLLGLAAAPAASNSRDLLGIRNVKNSQVPHRIPIVGIQPELIELIRRRQLGIEPDRPRLPSYRTSSRTPS